MSRRIIRLLACFAAAALVMALQKGVFMLVYGDLYAGAGVGACLRAVAAGLPMDLSVAGYLTVVPGLLLVASAWLLPAVTDRLMRVWYGVTSPLLAAVWTLDLTLYGYWGFKLDSTPLFYFVSSPSAALASAPWYLTLAGLAGVALAAWLLWLLFAWLIRLTPLGPVRGRGAVAGVMLALTALLFIPIRGGVTVSTMNLSSAYHSADMRLNHAAVNPAFSLLYSLTHRADFGSEARYMDDADARRLLDLPPLPADSVAADTASWLRPGVERPDIYVIILESFSSHLLPSLGGGPVAPGLDSLARTGLSFTHCYAPGFRTDRGIPAILSGYPCPPATSVMKHVDVAERLPSLAASLAAQGYGAEYYYGGDINFTNQLAYLRAGGYGRIFSDRDWPVSQRLSKWGVHDGPMLRRVWREVRDAGGGPWLRVIQTSSSHEPFEVPRIASAGTDPRVNAFAYADSCVTAFVDSLATLPSWGRTLVVLTADHYGAYPDRPDRLADRHHVPLVLTGGALERRGADSTLCSHVDIAPTLATLAGGDASPFVWGHTLTDRRARRLPVLADRDLLGVVIAPDSVAEMRPDAPAPADPPVLKAWLQLNYRYLDRLRGGR